MQAPRGFDTLRRDRLSCELATIIARVTDDRRTLSLNPHNAEWALIRADADAHNAWTRPRDRAAVGTRGAVATVLPALAAAK